VLVKVVDVDVSRRRISLSIKRVSDLEAGLVPEAEIEAEIAPEEQPPTAAVAVVGDGPEPAPGAEVAPEPEAEAPPVTDVPAASSETGAVPEAGAQPAPEPAEPAASVPAAEEAEPAAAAPSAPAEDDEDISLEAILEDLRRREGRTD
jgi:hypothetical protein